MTISKKELSLKQRKELIGIFETRFVKNMNRHKGLKWADVLVRLNAKAEKLWSLNEMEKSGGEPDVIGFDKKTGEYIFCDCSLETPLGRRNTCYDREGWESRNIESRPKNNAIDMATAMGIEILTEEQYRELQTIGSFDQKTSSWLKTPADVRRLGGAIFADYRYGRIFVYHNSAPTYYSSRGFRGMLKI